MFVMPVHAPAQPLLMLIIALAAVAVSSLFIGHSMDKIREMTTRYSERSDRDKLISDINTSLLSINSPEQLYELAIQYIYDVSQCPCTFYLPNSDVPTASYPDGLIMYPTEAEAADFTIKHGVRCGFGSEDCASCAFTYLPVKANGKTLSAVGILNNEGALPRPEILSAIDLILIRVGVVLEKQQLYTKHQQTLVEKELEKMRGDFLRAISHDFRTPLTGIIGACSTLNQESVSFDKEVRTELITSISEEATWLLRMVENLLSVTRVGGDTKLNLSLEPIEELLGEVMTKSAARFPEVRLVVKHPDDLLMVPMDPTLIMQVLMNLIDNAFKYSEGSKQIDVIVTELEHYVSFCVRDYGRGLSEAALEGLFIPSAGRAGDSTQGMGLGLSICRSIIRAHGGDIRGGNRAGGGAEFTFTLPKEAGNDRQ